MILPRSHFHGGSGRWPREVPYLIAVPWDPLAVVLVAMLGAGPLTRSRPPIELRRAG